ncbi:monovalent cation/H(+) antiporter subunit G [Rubritalea tangerina]|uniref:Monovalent cation/H(+) antiporter subunit G n=1 Tax=Rubritalea tangerina TaxID=430798 RepID=A0ABW4Z651_9BACT
MIVVISGFLLVGCFFALLAAIGVVRMPDIYCRMHSATKAGAFGSALILIAVMLAHPTPRVLIECMAILIFFYITAPVGAHLVGRICYRTKLPFWKPGKK